MPTGRKPIPSLSPAAAAEELRRRLDSLSPYYDRPQNLDVIRTLQEGLVADRERLERLEAERQTLIARIAEAGDHRSLKGAHDALNTFELDRFLERPSVSALHRSCTDYRDVLARRTLALLEGELAAEGRGAPPLPYALLSMGSDGREEQTLITDQDYLLVWDDGGDDSSEAYFLDFSVRLVDRLEAVGFRRCTGDIMTSNPTWRGSFTSWRRRLQAIIRFEYEDYAKNLMDLIVLSDARYVGGSAELAQKLVATVRGFEEDNFPVIWGLARAATEMHLALGFWNRLRTEPSGPHKGFLNIKLLAWAPLVMNVRILAVNRGLGVTPTLRRIAVLAEDGSLAPELASDLAEAYHFLTRLRIQLQIDVLQGRREDSYYLDPRPLDATGREQLLRALHRIRELQKIIHTNFSIV